MKLVIDIPKFVYHMTVSMDGVIAVHKDIVSKAIVNGIPLPEEHKESGAVNIIERKFEA